MRGGAGNAGAPIAPAASCARVESTRVATTGTPNDPAFPARRCYGLCSRSPRSTGLVSLRRLAKRPAKLDTSVGVPGPHDFAVRMDRARLAPPNASIASRTTCRDDHDTPLLWARDGFGYTADLGFGKSEIFLMEGIDRGSGGRPDGQISWPDAARRNRPSQISSSMIGYM
jgi:hypothetical protein